MQGESGRRKAESGNERNAACFLDLAQQRFGRGVKRSAPQRAQYRAPTSRGCDQSCDQSAINLIAGAANSR